MRYYFLLIWLVFACPVFAYAQEFESAPKTTTNTAADSMVTIEILPGVRKLEFRKVNDSTQLQILAGNVKLKQGTALFDCDSCVINNFDNTFEAWGHVHINDSDTTNVYSNHLRYLIRKKIAFLDGGVTLTDGKGTLTTPDLEYDMETKIGIYKHGGTVKNNKSVLTSEEGYYFSDLRDVYFKKNVVLDGPAHHMVTDSLLYNTENSTARFIAMTYIRDTSGRTVETKEGYYNTQTGKAEFAGRPVIRDKKVTMIADVFRSDDSTGVAQAKGNAVIIDSANNMTIIAGMIYRNRKTEAMLATERPLMIKKQDKDSIFIRADTFFSAKLSDLRAFLKAKADSVQHIQDSLQVIADSLKIITAKADSLKADSLRIVRAKTDSLKLSSDTLNASHLTDSLRLSADSTSLKDSTIGQALKKPDPDIKVAPPPNKPPDSIQPIRPDESKQKIPVDSVNSIANPTDAERKQRDSLIQKDSVPIKPATDSMTSPMTGIDTIRMAKMDTIVANDSTDRYFEAYHHVKIFSDSMQAASDSLFYSFKDSVFRLYQDPVVWSNKSQITGDTMYLYTKNQKADHIRVFNHSFMVNIVKPEIFNQVKSTHMEGYFTDGNIDSLRCSGLAECIYFIQDEDSAFTGINESKSDVLDFYFSKKELHKVVFRSSVSGTIWPMHQKQPGEMRLEGFHWYEDRRPKSKFELME